MVCMGLKPGTAKWKAQTNSLSFGVTPFTTEFTLRNAPDLLLHTPNQ